jgi:hypothetical protein
MKAFFGYRSVSSLLKLWLKGSNVKNALVRAHPQVMAHLIMISFSVLQNGGHLIYSVKTRQVRRLSQYPGGRELDSLCLSYYGCIRFYRCLHHHSSSKGFCFPSHNRSQITACRQNKSYWNELLAYTFANTFMLQECGNSKYRQIVVQMK